MPFSRSDAFQQIFRGVFADAARFGKMHTKCPQHVHAAALGDHPHIGGPATVNGLLNQHLRGTDDHHEAVLHASLRERAFRNAVFDDPGDPTIQGVIIILDLVATDGGKLPSFSAGAHIDVEVAPGLVRQYSLCTSPAETDRYRVAILLEPASRGGSAGIHRDFTLGRRVRIGRPRNGFPLNTDAKHSVLVAGGIGITPLLAMAHHLQGRGESFELHYCSRTRSRTAFLGLLADSFANEGRLHFDDGNIEQRFDPKVDLGPPRAGVHIYICGPSGFMAWVIDSARAAGWGQEQLHLEYFTADVDATGGAFVVQTRAGRKVQVDSGRSIAIALREAGIDVPLSCEQGVCGTCLVPVLAGVPDHRDVYQTDAEKAANSHVACCCSRAVSPVLILDI